MEIGTQRKRGRPPTGRALTAAERARRYRARVRARGLRPYSTLRQDPSLSAVRFRADTHLTPGEQDVLRRFCGAFGSLDRPPLRAAVFGSRARGVSHAGSDLDVAVIFAPPRNSRLEAHLAAIALAAQRPYWLGAYGIHLRAVPFCEGEGSALLDAAAGEMETVWTRP